MLFSWLFEFLKRQQGGYWPCLLKGKTEKRKVLTVIFQHANTELSISPSIAKCHGVPVNFLSDFCDIEIIQVASLRILFFSPSM